MNLLSTKHTTLLSKKHRPRQQHHKYTSSNNNKPSPLNIIEPLQLIFSFIDDYTINCSIAAVCRQWNQLNQHRLYRELWWDTRWPLWDEVESVVKRIPGTNRVRLGSATLRSEWRQIAFFLAELKRHFISEAKRDVELRHLGASEAQPGSDSAAPDLGHHQRQSGLKVPRGFLEAYPRSVDAQSPHLVRLKAIRSPVFIHNLDINDRAQYGGLDTYALDHLANHYKAPVHRPVWMCRGLRTLHMEIHGTNIYDSPVNSRIVFGYIAALAIHGKAIGDPAFGIGQFSHPRTSSRSEGARSSGSVAADWTAVEC
ncbi:MAG: hypothetical protein J3R72DRAFT_501318 [Linnemannia gamsii]|nr:MAG: hypothetical protein J3R72DRAFT_501318 [Linnemannia gamsii]